jgi:hypothetical protein
LSVIAKAQTAPTTRPVTTAPRVSISPQAGVMATMPATADETTPMVVTLPVRHFSTSGQVTMAPAAPSWVLMNAAAAVPWSLSAEPELKPNQPNQRSPAPITTSGMLLGRSSRRAKSRGARRTSATARPATPELSSTGSPPAKSRAPRCLTIQPSWSNTQWASGT